jgi:hypothetical protein
VKRGNAGKVLIVRRQVAQAMSLQVVDRFGRCGESKAGAGFIDHNTVDGLTGSNYRGAALNLAAAAPLEEIPARRPQFRMAREVQGQN